MPRRIVPPIAWALVALVLAAGFVGPRPLQAREALADWEMTGLTGRTIGLMTPPGGALFAVEDGSDVVGQSTFGALWQSDDGGDTWREIGVPMATERVAIDPTNSSTIYAAGWRLNKTTDGGTTWTRLLSNGLPEARDLNHARHLSVGRADHQLLYLYQSTGPWCGLLRSHDGGQTWEQTRPQSAPAAACNVAMPVLLTDPVSPARLLRVTGGWVVGGDIAAVSVSEDHGSTWDARGKPDLDQLGTVVTTLVGWQGVRPERLYATAYHTEISDAAGRSARIVGRSIFRSDDEGRAWTLLFTTVQRRRQEPVPAVTGLAYDPARPDVVYYSTATGVRVSTDAGQTWSDLGRPSLPRISSIVLGVDGHTLYAATEAGVLRLRLVD